MSNFSSQFINTFANNLFNRGKLEQFSEEDQELYLDEMKEVIVERIGLTMLEQLSTDDATVFKSEYVDNKQYDSPEAREFLSKKCGNIQPLIEASLRDFATKFLIAVDI